MNSIFIRMQLTSSCCSSHHSFGGRGEVNLLLIDLASSDVSSGIPSNELVVGGGEGGELHCDFNINLIKFAL